MEEGLNILGAQRVRVGHAVSVFNKALVSARDASGRGR